MGSRQTEVRITLTERYQDSYILGVGGRKTTEAVEMVKTSLKLPADLWRAAHIKALDERTDLQVIVARALKEYLKKGESR